MSNAIEAAQIETPQTQWRPQIFAAGAGLAAVGLLSLLDDVGVVRISAWAILGGTVIVASVAIAVRTVQRFVAPQSAQQTVFLGETEEEE